MGCTTAQQTRQLNNSERLTNHAEFKYAAAVAPKFTEDALKTINELEYDLENR